MVATRPHTTQPAMTAAEPSRLRLVRVEMGGLTFALPLSAVAAVVEPATIERSEDQGARLGEIHSRLGAIPVFHGGQVLGIGDPATPPGRILVLRGERPLGLAVERVLDPREVERDAAVLLPETARLRGAALVAGVVWVENDTVELLLDIETLMAELLGESYGAQPDVYALRRRLQAAEVSQVLELLPAPDSPAVALPVTVVRHVADYREPHPLPLAQADVLGLLAWLRQPIPVLDLAARLGVVSPGEQPAKVVVVGEPAAPGSDSTSALAALAVHQIGSLHSAPDSSAGDSLWAPARHIRVLDLAELLLGR